MFFALQKGEIFRTSTLLLLRSTGYEFRGATQPIEGREITILEKINLPNYIGQTRDEAAKKELNFYATLLPFVFKHVLNKIVNRNLMQFNYQ